MTKFTDLDIERKTQLFLNFRIQTLLTAFVAESQGVDIQLVIESFYDKAASEVFSMSKKQINKHLEEMENAIQGHINNQTKGVVHIKFD